MNELKLKPCPFCGGDAKTVRRADEDGGIFYHVFCSACYVETDGYAKKEFAIEAWNRRDEK